MKRLTLLFFLIFIAHVKATIVTVCTFEGIVTSKPKINNMKISFTFKVLSAEESKGQPALCLSEEGKQHLVEANKYEDSNELFKSAKVKLFVVYNNSDVQIYSLPENDKAKLKVQ